MENKRALQREASTKRILEASIREFTDRGYAGALLGSIAGKAGVAGSILSERFGGKDKICEAALGIALEPYVKIAESCSDAEGGLLNLAGFIRSAYNRQEPGALFLAEMLRSKTLPDNCRMRFTEVFRDTALFHELEKAAAEGRLIGGKTSEALYAFLRSVFILTESAATAGLPLPGDATYLRFILPESPEAAKKDRKEDYTGAEWRRVYIDPLTGCYNRQYFQDYMRELCRGDAAVFLDVNDFHTINEGFGHSIGDAVLQEIVRIAAEKTGTNTIVRMGGDEFLLLLSGVTRAKLEEKLRALRDAMDAVCLPEAPGLCFSAFIGSAYAETENMPFDTIREELETGRESLCSSGEKPLQKSLRIREQERLPEPQENGIPVRIDPLANAELLRSFVEDYEIILSAEPARGSVQLHQATGRVKKWIRENRALQYDEMRQAYAEEYLHPEDKLRFLSETAMESILERLKSEDSFYLNYRILYQGVLLYYQLKLVQDPKNGGRVLLGIHSIDESRRNDIRMLEEQARARQRAVKEREIREREQTVISGFISRFAAVYLMDLEKGTLQPYGKESSDNRPGTPEAASGTVLRNMIDTWVTEEDREKAAACMDPAMIRKRLKENTEYSVFLRTTLLGTGRHYKVTFLRLGSEEPVREVLIGLSDGQAEAVEQLVRDKMNAEFDSAYVLDINRNRFRVLVTSGSHTGDILGEEGDFGPTLQYVLAAVDPEQKSLFAPLEDMNALREYLKTEDKREFTFRVPTYGLDVWWRCIVKVLEREKGDAALAVILFAMLDKSSSEELNAERLKKRYNRIINSLAAGYTDVYFVDFLQGTIENFTESGKRLKAADALLAKSGSLKQIADAFIGTAIHPEDRTKMQEVIGGARERLQNQQSFSVDFRRRYSGGYLNTRMKAVKTDAEGEAPTGAVLGFEIIEEQIRAEKRQELLIRDGIRLLYEEKDAEKAIHTLLRSVAEYHKASSSYICELQNGRFVNTYECNSEVPEAEMPSAKGLRAEMIPDWYEAFRKEGGLIIDNPEEYRKKNPYAGRVLKEIGIRRIMIAPMVSGSTVTGYIGVDNPEEAMGEMMVLRSMAALIHSEILRRKQSDEEHIVMKRLTKSFDVVSFVNLKTDYLRVYSISEKNLNRYGLQRSYSAVLGGYIETDVAEEDRERLRRMTEPAFVMQQLRKKESFEVNFTDRAGNVPKNYCLSFIRADEAGESAVICGIDNTAVVEREKERQRQQQRQLELTVEERTAELRERNKALDRVNEGIVELLGDITEARDNDSGQHVRRVKGFTYILADQVRRDLPEYRLTETRVALMTSASALHDIGKIMIPDSILLKPGPLTEPEYEIMKTHPLRGYEILEKAPADWNADYLAMSQEIALCHHEKWDGNGYPSGLKGDEIPISAQIVSVADCYDALTSKRVYKEPFSPEEAFDMILRGECGVFPEKLMNSFRKCRSRFIRRITNPEEDIPLMPRPGMDMAGLSDMHILLAEDNELCMEIEKEILESEGAKVSCAANGREALRLFRETEPGFFNAILMDVYMPGMDGPETARAIRKLELPFADTVPIIALTAAEARDVRLGCMNAGMDAFLSKPINITMLIKVLLDCMKNQSLNLRKKLEKARREQREAEPGEQ